MANKIIAVLKYPALAGEMARKAREELRQIRWETAAERIAAIYRETARNRPLKTKAPRGSRCPASVSIFRSISPGGSGDTPIFDIGQRP